MILAKANVGKESDGFFDSVKAFFGEGGVLKLLVVLAIGALLVLFGSGAGESEASGDIDLYEERLSEICSELDGVGECEVMLVYKYNTDKYGRESEKSVESVAVVCEGAGSVKVRKELTSLFTTLFGIGSNRVSISQKKS